MTGIVLGASMNVSIILPFLLAIEHIKLYRYRNYTLVAHLPFQQQNC